MIDKKPAVGRYLCKESIWITGGTHRGGLITKISGKRIYFYPIDRLGRTEEYEEYVNKFAAICDTREEYDHLQEFSRLQLEEWSNMMKRHKVEWQAQFTKEEPK